MRRVPKRPGLYEVRPGTYKLMIYAGVNERGKSSTRSRTFTAASDRAAIKAANAVAADIERVVAERATRAATLNGLIDRWEKVRAGSHSPSTGRGQAAIRRRTRKDLGRVRLDELDAGIVDDWMADLLASGLSTTTVANHHSFLRAVVRQGKRWRMIASTDCVTDSTPPTRISTRRPTPPAARAVGVLWATATPDLRVAVALAAWAGLRRGEVMALRWSDVDVAGRAIHVRRARALDSRGVEHDKLPKSGRPRRVEADDWLLWLLALHRADLHQRARSIGATLPDDGPVLPDPYPGRRRKRPVRNAPFGTVPRKLDWLTLAWTRHRERHGATGVTYHDLRHHFATEMIEAGVPFTAVQGQLGHIQLATTMGHYSHVVDDTRRAAAAVVGARRQVPALGPARSSAPVVPPGISS